MTREGAIAILRASSTSLAALGVVRVGLFGSTARGEAHEGSDVDLLLQFDPARKSLDAFMDAADLLEAAFPVSIDVLTTESLNPHMASRVLSEAEFHETRA